MTHQFNLSDPGFRPSLPLPTPSNIDMMLLNAPPGFKYFELMAYGEVLHAFKPKNGKPTAELIELDKFRYDKLPDLVQGRHVKSSQGWIKLDELERLMTWKLTRGTHRPTLQSLIASNEPSMVISATAQAFKEYHATVEKGKPDHTKALRTLCTLKGVGAATGSLVLSVAYPNKLPYFSDELLAWLRGWKSTKEGKIGYTNIEYAEIVSGVEALVERLKAWGPKVDATAVEKVAWTIMKVQDDAIWKAVFGEDEPAPGPRKRVETSNEPHPPDEKADASVPQEDEDEDEPEAEDVTAAKPTKEPIKKRKTATKVVEQTTAAKRPRRT